MSRTLLAVLVAGMLLPLATRAEAPTPAATGKYNILLVTCDQRTYQVLQARGYAQPALDTLARRGVTFKGHYIASAVCTPSRGVMFTGLAPQTTGIQEEMMFGWTPSMSTERVSMGTAMKKLGYATAYYGKFELDRDTVYPQPSVNYASSLQKYGFDTYQSYGEVTGGRNQGYVVDGVIAADGVSWLRSHASSLRRSGTPWFMVLSFINPHDVLWADANLPGQSVQKPVSPSDVAAIPDDAAFAKDWEFPLWSTVDQPIRAPGRPAAHWEFFLGTETVFGQIPATRRDMWHVYDNYYLNLLRENDRQIGSVLQALDALDLWKDTIVVFTADHGELGGSHGGMRNKGPVTYEQNVHVPMIVVHPAARGGTTRDSLTSHIDLLPTLAGLSAAPPAAVAGVTAGLPGRDFSRLVTSAEAAPVDAVRPGILFNYVGLSTVSADFFVGLFTRSKGGKGTFDMTPADLATTHPDLSKRGFLSMTFDGRYKYARYYAPSQFNTPRTLQEILAYNDVELFDLKEDPDERRNLALDPEGNAPLILRMNALLNELMAREVGTNDGRFLPAPVRPKGSVCCQ